MIRGLIIAHSNLAQALLSTVEKIAGPQNLLLALSNEDCSNDILAEKIRLLLDDRQPTIIFTDFIGGSTYAVARQTVHSYCHTEQSCCAAVTGVNLPMLISFVTKRESLTFPALLETLREDGHRGIQ